MADETPTPPLTVVAWQPLTFGGVARFGQAPLGRLLLVQGLFALGAALVAVWCVATAWAPGIREAIARLPNQGVIRSGRLEWPQAAPTRLTENRFLSILIAPTAGPNPGQVSDLQLEFGQTELRIRSLFGYVAVDYPTGWVIGLNRSELQPWWGAWWPAVYAVLVAGGVAGLFLCWWTLALVYLGPARIMAFLAGRRLGWWPSWKICGAALMPGALVLSIAILLYGLQRLNLGALLVLVPFHFALGWIYVLIAPARLPKPGVAPSTPADGASDDLGKANPFGQGTPESKEQL